MPFDDTIVLATACINQPKLERRPARTLLVGAAILTVRQRFSGWSFDLQCHSTTITDNPADTMTWLGENLSASNKRLLVWRAEDIVVPSLITATDTARDQVAAAHMLHQLKTVFAGEVIDVAAAHGGALATSFDAVAHQHGLPFVPMTRGALSEAHRTGCHGAIRDHLAARAIATWRLWLRWPPGNKALEASTAEWLEGADPISAGMNPDPGK
jgi:hypothetical protein